MVWGEVRTSVSKHIGNPCVGLLHSTLRMIDKSNRNTRYRKLSHIQSIIQSSCINQSEKINFDIFLVVKIGATAASSYGKGYR